MIPTDEHVEGFEVPVHQSLIQPDLLAGVPRLFFVLNLTVCGVLTLGLRVWWAGLPIGITLHAVASALTQQDPDWFEIVRRHILHRHDLEP